MYVFRLRRHFVIWPNDSSSANIEGQVCDQWWCIGGWIRRVVGMIEHVDTRVGGTSCEPGSAIHLVQSLTNSGKPTHVFAVNIYHYH